MRQKKKNEIKQIPTFMFRTLMTEFQEEKKYMIATHPRLVVKDGKQVHGIILVLLSQRAAGKVREGNTRQSFYFPASVFGLLNDEEDVCTCQLWWWGCQCLCNSALQQVWSFSCVRGRLVSERPAPPVWPAKQLDYLQRNATVKLI